jgi:anaerobic selenocysteine-containing dehydrogenase
MTSRFAAVHLAGATRRNMLDLVAAVLEASGGAKKGWQKRLVEGVDASAGARALAKRFVDSEESVVVVSTSDPVVAHLTNALVKAAGDNKRLFALHDYGNARDIMAMFTGGVSVEDVIESAGRGELEVLLVLGVDLVASYPNLDVSGALSRVPLLVAGAPFANRTTELAGIVLPTALWIETDGTFNGAMRQRVIEPPGGALSYGDILKMAAKAMGIELHAAEPAEMLKEEALTEDRAGEIVKAAREEGAPCPVESTAISFADGSLTGRMSWVKMVERVS